MVQPPLEKIGPYAYDFMYPFTTDHLYCVLQYKYSTISQFVMYLTSPYYSRHNTTQTIVV